MAYFLAIGSVCGCLMWLLNPDGLFMKIDVLTHLRERLPWLSFMFKSPIPSCILVVICCTFTNLVSIYLWHTRHKVAWLSSVICGVIVMLWARLEFFVWGHENMSTITLFIGFAQMVVAFIYYAAWIKASLSEH